MRPRNSVMYYESETYIIAIMFAMFARTYTGPYEMGFSDSVEGSVLNAYNLHI